MKKKMIVFVMICISIFNANVTVFATENSDSFIATYELNQWKRSSNSFSFSVETAKSAEKALYSGLITAVSAGIGNTGGPAGAAIGACIGSALSSVANDCIEKNYSKFGKTGYGTVVVARYSSKLRMSIRIYTDSARKNLVFSDTYSTDSYPI